MAKRENLCSPAKRCHGSMYVRLVYLSHGCVEQGNPLVEQHTTSYQWLKMMIRVTTVLLILLLNGGIRAVCRMFSFAMHVVTATDHQHRPGSSSVYYHTQNTTVMEGDAAWHYCLAILLKKEW